MHVICFLNFLVLSMEGWVLFEIVLGSCGQRYIAALALPSMVWYHRTLIERAAQRKPTTQPRVLFAIFSTLVLYRMWQRAPCCFWWVVRVACVLWAMHLVVEFAKWTQKLRFEFSECHEQAETPRADQATWPENSAPAS